MRASRPERAATSLVEVLVALAILGVALVPIVDMFVASRRAGHSAGRLVDVSLHAQMLLEALALIGPEELPPIPPAGEAVLLSDSGPALAGGGAVYDVVRKAFARPPPLRMERTVFGTRLETGELALRIEVVWDAIEGETRTAQAIDLHMLATPRAWE